MPTIQPTTRSNAQDANIVLAPSFDDEKQYIKLFVSPSTVRNILDDCFNSKLGEYCGLVHGGNLTRGLLESHALFRGLNRPYIGPNRDDDMYVYVTNPSCSYIFPIWNEFSEEGCTPTQKPRKAVFTTIVTFSLQEIEETRRKEGSGLIIPSDISGVVKYWEWVVAGNNDNLPENFQNRYTRRVW